MKTSLESRLTASQSVRRLVRLRHAVRLGRALVYLSLALCAVIILLTLLDAPVMQVVRSAATPGRAGLVLGPLIMGALGIWLVSTASDRMLSQQELDAEDYARVAALCMRYAPVASMVRAWVAGDPRLSKQDLERIEDIAHSARLEEAGQQIGGLSRIMDSH